MRKLGHELGVEAMALYYHFANKDQVIDGIVDLVFAEIDLPVAGMDWRAAMRRRAISLYDVLLRHRWAIGMMESRRNPGPGYDFADEFEYGLDLILEGIERARGEL